MLLRGELILDEVLQSRGLGGGLLEASLDLLWLAKDLILALKLRGVYKEPESREKSVP